MQANRTVRLPLSPTCYQEQKIPLARQGENR